MGQDRLHGIPNRGDAAPGWPPHCNNGPDHTPRPDTRQGGRREGKFFFSEEKKQNTFMSCAGGKIPAMASIVGVAKN
jgi:hypothetical protein